MKEKSALDYDLILTLASDCGFDLCGVARSRELNSQRDHFGSFLSCGFHGTLGYLERNFDKRLNPTLLVDDARSIICCAVSYNNRAWKRQSQVASYALTTDYHISIREMLRNLFAKLKECYPNLEGRAFVDTAPVLEKAWAVECGLGWIGRNSLLITPEYGSFVVLGELIVNLESNRYSAPFDDNRCGECRRCMDSCPTGAIVDSRVIDTRRCISRLTVERSIGSVDPDTDLHGWIFGCDACQSVCPHNQKAAMYRNPRFAPLVDPQTLDSQFWSTHTDEELKQLFSSSAMFAKR